jgi:hypothetical protein
MKKGQRTVHCPFQTAGKVIFEIFGSAGQEPNVPAPRISDKNPFLDLSSGLTEICFYRKRGFFITLKGQRAMRCPFFFSEQASSGC